MIVATLERKIPLSMRVTLAEVLVERFLAGDSSAELARDYGRTEEEIQEAIRFEKLAA